MRTNRRSVRPAGRGADAALVALRPSSTGGRPPTSWPACRALMAPPAWKLDPATRTAERLSDCPLSLNGIAKGYIVGRACDAALGDSNGINGRSSERRRRPARLRRLHSDRSGSPLPGPTRNRAILWPSSRSRTARSPPAAARSAACESAASGIRTSSIPEPASRSSGSRARRSSPARAIDADALAKACCVLEPEQSLRLIQSLPETECLIVMANGDAREEQRLGASGTPAPGGHRPGRRSQAQDQAGCRIRPRKKTRRKPKTKPTPVESRGTRISSC